MLGACVCVAVGGGVPVGVCEELPVEVAVVEGTAPTGREAVAEAVFEALEVPVEEGEAVLEGVLEGVTRTPQTMALSMMM